MKGPAGDTKRSLSQERRMKRKCLLRIVPVLLVVFFGMVPFGLAYEVNEKLSVGGVAAGVYQYQDLIDNNVGEDVGRGALVFQPEASFRPTERDELFLKLGFAEGNGLREVSPFFLDPWAADLEDDVKNINGRNRDHILTAWYKHTFELPNESTIGLTGGIIDSTEYLDQNAFMGDEYTQFMNQAFVQAANAFLPSYDWGGAVEFEAGNLTIRGVGMAIGENRDGIANNFYGVIVSHIFDTKLGKGKYNIGANITTEDFLSPDGTSKERRKIVIFNGDQEFGDNIGGFMRILHGSDAAAVTYDTALTGGIYLKGNKWGRPKDNAAIAYGYAFGGNREIDNTHVAEAYARFALHKYFALTLDVQYMRDKYKVGNKIEGFIYGLRAVAEF
jgi:porin